MQTISLRGETIQLPACSYRLHRGTSLPRHLNGRLDVERAQRGAQIVRPFSFHEDHRVLSTHDYPNS